MVAKDEKLPFNMGYVLRKTSKHIRMYIDISLRKTLDRVEEFADDKDKSREIFETLSILNKWRRELDDFQSKHADSFNKW